MNKGLQLFIHLATGFLLCLPMVLNAANPANLLDATIFDLQKKLDADELTSVQLVDFYLARIAAYDQEGPALNSITAVNPAAMETAMKLDRERATRGPRGPLHGIPLLLKDNYESVDTPTSVGSMVFKGWMAPHDAEIVRRLREAGAIILGKANMHELAMGLRTHGTLFGQTRNPYDPARMPGGSSGGTGAAIAAGFATAGFGSDTCGSIRVPASHNSLVGMRSTVGLSSRRGIVPLSHSWDVGGPMTRSVSDLAVIFDVIAGYDPQDPETAASYGHIPSSYTAFLKKGGLAGKRLGLLTNLMVVDPEDEEVAQIIRGAAEEMRNAGAEVEEVRIPNLQELMNDETGGFKITLADIRTDLNAFLAAHPTAPVQSIAEIMSSELFVDQELKDYLEYATSLEPGPTLEYLRLQAKRETIRQAVYVAMAKAEVDAFVYPTIRRKPALIGGEQEGSNCFLSGHTSFPSITVPAGFTRDGLPVGVEFLAREWQEPLLIQLAYAYEQSTRHRKQPVTTPPLN